MELVAIGIGIWIVLAIIHSQATKPKGPDVWILPPPKPQAGCGLLIVAGLSLLAVAGFVMACF